MDFGKINLWHSTRGAIRKANTAAGKKSLDQEILRFRKDALLCLKTIVLKLKERSPLKFKLTRAASSLNPSLRSSEEKVAKQRLEILCDILTDHKIVSGELAEKASRQFKALIKQDKFKDSAAIYSRSTQRVDHFWRNHCNGREELKDIWKDIKLILIMFHGNSSLERGFSINKECLDDNLREESDC